MWFLSWLVSLTITFELGPLGSCQLIPLFLFIISYSPPIPTLMGWMTNKDMYLSSGKVGVKNRIRMIIVILEMNWYVESLLFIFLSVSLSLLSCQVPSFSYFFSLSIIYFYLYLHSVDRYSISSSTFPSLSQESFFFVINNNYKFCFNI